MARSFDRLCSRKALNMSLEFYDSSSCNFSEILNVYDANRILVAHFIASRFSNSFHFMFIMLRFRTKSYLIE
jgi:hypothetical protein